MAPDNEQDRIISDKFLRELQKHTCTVRWGSAKYYQAPRDLIRSRLSGIGVPASDLDRFIEILEEQDGFGNHAFEDPMLKLIVDNLSREIEQVLEDNQIPCDYRPVVGAVASPIVNARAIMLSESRIPVVILNWDLFPFVHAVSKIVSLLLPLNENDSDAHVYSYTSEDIMHMADSHKDLPFYMGALIQQFSQGEYGLSEKYQRLDHRHAAITNILTHSAELFVMGHEYGHILEKHFNQLDCQVCSFGSEEYPVFNQSWGNEYEADAHGFMITLAAMGKRGHDIITSAMGPFILLIALQYMKRTYDLKRSGMDPGLQSKSIGTDTHPPIANRRDKLIELFVNSDEDVSKNAEAIEYISKGLERGFERLWERAFEDKG